MPLYINKDIIIVNNKVEKDIFLYDRKNRAKSLINDDMFEILNYIYENEGITVRDFLKTYAGLEDVIDELFNLNVLMKVKQKRCNNVKIVENLDTARLFVELTDKCNLRCKHCYGNFKCENNHILSIDKLDSLINQAINLNVY